MGYGNVSERRRQQPRIGVSVVILALGPAGGDGNDSRAGLWMPLVRRVRQPYQGMWALPGGDVRADATLEASAYEALESTTDLHSRYLEQLYTFGGPGRSGMGLPMVSVVYWALVARNEAKSMTWDAGRGDGNDDNVRWFSEDRLPQLAFDHRAIIDYAIERLRTKIDYSDVATRLLGPTFTLRQLHDVHEAIAARPIDLANFRRKALAGGELEPTGDKRREGRQRPAAVYRYRRVSHDDPAGPGGLWGEALERLDHGERTATGASEGTDMPDEDLRALIPGAR